MQKAIIDTQGRKASKGDCFEVECSQSAVSKHMNRNLSGRERCERKRCRSSRDDCHLESIVRKRSFKSVGEIQKEWTEAGVNVLGATDRTSNVVFLRSSRF